MQSKEISFYRFKCSYVYSFFCLLPFVRIQMHRDSLTGCGFHEKNLPDYETRQNNNVLRNLFGNYNPDGKSG
jgi:hypothetical protein